MDSQGRRFDRGRASGQLTLAVGDTEAFLVYTEKKRERKGEKPMPVAPTGFSEFVESEDRMMSHLQHFREKGKPNR